jgi:hypothetical protein
MPLFRFGVETAKSLRYEIRAMLIVLKLHFLCYDCVEYKILSAQKHCKTHQKNGAVMCQSAWETFTSTNRYSHIQKYWEFKNLAMKNVLSKSMSCINWRWQWEYKVSFFNSLWMHSPRYKIQITYVWFSSCSIWTS